MGKPITLIGPKLLDELHAKNMQGVSRPRLIRDYNLDITPPTLAKLIKHYDLMKSTADRILNIQIGDSLFPYWVKTDGLTKQDTNKFLYRGKMPLGQWIDK